MARIGVFLFLAVGILSISANGYELPGKQFVSKIIDKASSFVGKQNQNDVSLEIPDNAYVVENMQIPFTCPADGFFSYPGNCTLGVVCLRGLYKIFTCTDVQHFNNVTKKCDNFCSAHCDETLACACHWESCHAPKEMSATDGSETDELTKNKLKAPVNCIIDGLFPNPVDCSKFYHCSNGRAYLKRCPAGLHFSVETKRCERPCDAGCDPTLSCKWKSSDTSAEMAPIEGNEFDDQDNDKPRISFTCLRDGLFASRDHCNQYFECSNGRLVFRTCPPGLHFNKKTKTCLIPCEAKCDPKISCRQEPSQTNETPDVRELTASDSSKSSKNIFKLKLKFLCFDEGLFPDPKDCSKYINCSNGISYELSCPLGMHFNSETKRCEKPCSAKCDPNLLCKWKQFKNKFQEEIMDSAIKTLCDKDGAYENPLLCWQYFKCEEGDINAFQCPNGQHFNKETLRCEEPCDAHCDLSLAEKCLWDVIAEPEIENITKGSSEELCSNTGVYLERNPLDCKTYFRCEDGDADLLECPNGQHFNQETLQCEEPCEAHCDLSMAESCDWESQNVLSLFLKQPMFDFQCPANGIYSNNACENFIQCTGGQAYLINCPNGEHFSANMERCTTPCQARCVPNYEDFCEDEPKSRSPKQLLKDFDCETDGYHANPLDCESFIQCFGGSAYSISCPPDLHYSPTLDICMSPCEAKCVPNYEDYCRAGELSCQCGWDGCKIRVNRAPTKILEDTFDYEMFLAASPPSLMYHFTCMKDGIYSNPENCSTFIQCSGGHSYLMACPKDMHFNERLKICDYPCEAHCDANLGCQCGWDTCELKANTFEEVDCEAEPDEGPCDGRFPRYGYYVESGRCRGFYYGGCGGNSNNFITLEECENKCKAKFLNGYRCPEDSGMFGHFPDCTRYYHCKRGIPTLKKCPKGTAFDHMKSKCVIEYKATCLYECRDKDAVYPYEEDCHKYIDCVNGISKLEKCPEGEAFDLYERDCVDEKQVYTCFLESEINLKTIFGFLE